MEVVALAVAELVVVVLAVGVTVSEAGTVVAVAVLVYHVEHGVEVAATAEEAEKASAVVARLDPGVAAKAMEGVVAMKGAVAMDEAVGAAACVPLSPRIPMAPHSRLRATVPGRDYHQ